MITVYVFREEQYDLVHPESKKSAPRYEVV